MRLYRRHVLSITAVFALCTGLSSLLSFSFIYKHIDDAKRERVALLSEVVTNGLKSIMMEGKPKEEFQKFLDSLAAEDVKAVRVFSDNGTIIGSTVPGEIGKRVDAQHLQSFKAHKGHSIFVHKSQDIDVYSSIMVMSNDWPCQRCHGSHDDIRAIVDLEVMQSSMDNLAGGAAAWSIGMFLVLAGTFSVIFVLISRKHIRRPIEKMTAEIKAMADGRSGARITLSGSDELDALASAINRLASEFENTKEELRLTESRETSYLEKMASIGEVAATVAHEIKNPLAGISGALQVMAEDIPDGSPRKEICSEILSEIARLDRSVKELVTYSRPQELNPSNIDLNSVVKKAVSDVSHEAKLLNINISLFSETLPEIYADPELIEKVMMAVLHFQMQLMPDGGAITISTDYDNEKYEARITTADTARALPPEKLRNVFKPSFSTKHTGSGLGLAVSRNIIESHKGRIKADSEPGIGNFFHIIIPAVRR